MKPMKTNWKSLSLVLIFVTLGLFLITGGASGQSKQFSGPFLILNSPMIESFDISWVDNVSQKYYLGDRSNNAVTLVDAARDKFLGFIGHGQFTGRIPCPNNPTDFRHCSGPNGVFTDNFGRVWAGDGDSTIKVADATKPGTTILKSIPTGGNFRVDEGSYDPVDQIVMFANDGDSPPFLTFVSSVDYTVLGHYFYPASQDGLEQSVWHPMTRLFYQNVPGKGVDVFDPLNFKNGPVASFPVSCAPGPFGLTVTGLTIGGPQGPLTVGCGSGGVSVNPRNGRIRDIIPEVDGADEVWFDPGENNYYFARGFSSPVGTQGYLGVVARNNEFIVNLPTVPSPPPPASSAHSVAANSANGHIFVPLPGVGITVFIPE